MSLIRLLQALAALLVLATGLLLAHMTAASVDDLQRSNRGLQLARSTRSTRSPAISSRSSCPRWVATTSRGHGRGRGAVLVQIADVMRRERRDGDLAGRLGGEEFVLMPGQCDLAHGRVFAERLRRAIAARMPDRPRRHAEQARSTPGRARAAAAPPMHW
jgi:hypothetical protein